MCTGRIKLLRNKKSIQVRALHIPPQLKDLRREIADLLANGKEDSARIRVEAVMRELDLMDAFEIIDLFAELLCVRLALIESTKDVPTDMREAVSSLLYASPRVRELPELAPVREQLMAKCTPPAKREPALSSGRATGRGSKGGSRLRPTSGEPGGPGHGLTRCGAQTARSLRCHAPRTCRRTPAGSTTASSPSSPSSRHPR
mmetsp:Transcript_32322/g.102781  ORF Transcript_32322/g.102781 Transcript_32322/m.102781 type:complete len:202 (+) Transcript_32322:40-645(+)